MRRALLSSPPLLPARSPLQWSCGFLSPAARLRNVSTTAIALAAPRSGRASASAARALGAAGGQQAHSGSIAASRESPMLQQYLSIRNDPQYRGCVILFQLGNFLEAFGDDAAICSRTLGIALTTRGATAAGVPIPMAGVPLWAKDGYISRLVKAGHRVVICEQLDGVSAVRAVDARGGAARARTTSAAGDAAAAAAAAAGAQAASNGLMRRQVTAVVTRGTAMDDALLSPRARNLVAGIAFEWPQAPPVAIAAAGAAGSHAAGGGAGGGSSSSSAAGGPAVGVCWVDVSTGDFFTTRVASAAGLAAELAVHAPVEIVVPSARAVLLRPDAPAPGGAGGGSKAPASAGTSGGIERVAVSLTRAPGTGGARSAPVPAAAVAAAAADPVIARLCELALRSAEAGDSVPQQDSTAALTGSGQTGRAAASDGASHLASRAAGGGGSAVGVAGGLPLGAQLLDLPGAAGGDGEPCAVTFLHDAAFSAAEGTMLVAQTAGVGSGAAAALAAAAAPGTTGAAAAAVAAAAAAAARLTPVELAAAAGTLRYVAWTQQGRLPLLRPPVSLATAPAASGDACLAAGDTPHEHPKSTQAEADAASAPGVDAEADADIPWLARATAAAAAAASQRLSVDPSTRRALELTRPLHGRRRARGCLLHTVDLCASSLGSRLLDLRLGSPLLAVPLLRARHDAVAHLLRRGALREELRAALAHVPDLERALHRVALLGSGSGSGSGGSRRGGAPGAAAALRDLATLRDGLAAAVRVGALLASGDAVAFQVPRAGRAGAPGTVACSDAVVQPDGDTAAADAPAGGDASSVAAQPAAASPDAADPASLDALAATDTPLQGLTAAAAGAGATAFFLSAPPPGLQLAMAAPPTAPLAASGRGKKAAAAARPDAVDITPAASGAAAAAGMQLSPYDATVAAHSAALMGMITRWASSSAASSFAAGASGNVDVAAALVDAGCRLDFDLALPLPPALRTHAPSQPRAAPARSVEELADAPVLTLAAAAAMLPHPHPHRDTSVPSPSPSAPAAPSVALLFAELQRALDPPVPAPLMFLHGTGAAPGSVPPPVAPAGAASGDAAASTADAAATIAADATSGGSAAAASPLRIRPGYCPELDAARTLRDSAQTAIGQLQERLRALTRVRTLRVKLTEDHGVVADVPAAAAASLDTFRHAALGAPSAGDAAAAAAAPAVGAAAAAAAAALPGFRRLKTLKSSVRYGCPALTHLDRELRDAAARAAAHEERIINDLSGRVAGAAAQVAAVARAVAVIDVSAALAEGAERYGLCRPTLLLPPSAAARHADADATAAALTARLVPGRHALQLRGLRHLVVERSLMDGWVSRSTGNALAGLAALSLSHAPASAWGGSDGSGGAAAEGALGSGDAVADDEADGLAGDGDALDRRELPEDPAPPAPFIPNDCSLGWLESDALAGAAAAPASGAARFAPALQGAAHVCLLTGSNMAGKSTALRAVAQAVILAQAGAFVPAASAAFTPVDRLFARVGASDDVSRGRSTFLVEMEETAAILAGATPASLVLVDEVGRGTAASDGLGIAWAVLEALAWRTRCRTLFATHMHELTAMALLREAAAAAAAAVGTAAGTGTAAAGSKRNSSGTAASPPDAAAALHLLVPAVQCAVMEAREDVLQLSALAGGGGGSAADGAAAEAGAGDGNGDAGAGDGGDHEDASAALPPCMPLLTHRMVPHPLVAFAHEHILRHGQEQRLQHRRGAAAAAAAPPVAGGSTAAQSPALLAAGLEEALWRRVSSLSHGIAVAARAGLPPSVLRRARQVARAVDDSAAALAWGRRLSRLLQEEAGAGADRLR